MRSSAVGRAYLRARAVQYVRPNEGRPMYDQWTASRRGPDHATEQDERACEREPFIERLGHFFKGGDARARGACARSLRVCVRGTLKLRNSRTRSAAFGGRSQCAAAALSSEQCWEA